LFIKPHQRSEIKKHLMYTIQQWTKPTQGQVTHVQP